MESERPKINNAVAMNENTRNKSRTISNDIYSLDNNQISQKFIEQNMSVIRRS